MCTPGNISPKLKRKKHSANFLLLPNGRHLVEIKFFFFTFDFKGKWLLGNVDIKVCILGLWGDFFFTTLINSAMQHISTFRGPTEERGLESSITKGKTQGNKQQIGNARKDGKLHQSQRAWRGIRIKTVAKVFKKSWRMHNPVNYSCLAVSLSTVRLTGPAIHVFLVSKNH